MSVRSCSPGAAADAACTRAHRWQSNPRVAHVQAFVRARGVCDGDRSWCRCTAGDCRRTPRSMRTMTSTSISTMRRTLSPGVHSPTISGNIPSEGFASVIYLLLLVPFEAADSNMMFAAVILNLAAIALTLYLSYQVLRADRVLDGGFLLIAVALFALFMARDPHIPIIVGRGLETMLGPASVLWAILHLARVHQAGDEATRRRAVTMFLVASFLAFLIRPENIVLLAAAGVLILVAMWRRGQLAALLARLGTFVAALGVYFAGKLIVFGDVMQTSYYQKMRFDPEDGSGREYVIGALSDYRRWILCAVVLGGVRGGPVAVAPARARVEYVQVPCAAIVRAGACRGRGCDLDGVSALGAAHGIRLSLPGQFLCLPVSDRRGGSCISAVARDPADRETICLRRGNRHWCGVDAVGGVDCGGGHRSRHSRRAFPPVHAGGGNDSATRVHSSRRVSPRSNSRHRRVDPGLR